MKKNYTTFSFLLVFYWFLFGGIGLSALSAQAGCGINRANFNVQSEKEIDGVLHKKVQVLVKNPNPGLAGKFYYLIDYDSRNDSTKFYPYDLNSDEFWIPVNAHTITFVDFNSPGCKKEYPLNFTPNVCTFIVHQEIILSGECYKSSAIHTVDAGTTIDSVIWLRNGSSESVHDSMNWINIPPGDYKIYFFNNKGCVAESAVRTCIEKSDAGNDHELQYCIGEDDTINLYNVLDDDVSSGSFYSESYDPLDSVSVSQLSFDIEGNMIYYYIASADNELPDTSQITINVRDCSICAYDLISAQRDCSDPERIEVAIGGGSPTDSTFMVTLPDGSTVTQKFYMSFEFDFPDFQDTARLYVHMDTPAGICDSTLIINPVPNPMVLITATEVDLPGDSVGVRVSASQRIAPYQVDVFVGSQQKTIDLEEGVMHQFDFLQSHDTAYIMARDDQGCMGLDTLVLTPDCIRPDVTHLQATCGQDNGQITIDPASLPAGRTITWMDTNESDLWERSGLAPGTYSYTVTYDDCSVEDSVAIEASAPITVDVITLNDCLIDGKATFYIQDSSQVVQWSVREQVLPYFSATCAANEDHTFYIETMDGCIDTVMVRADEPSWLNQIGYQEPKRLSALLGIDLNELSDFGWKFQDSILCHPCGDYESETKLDAGTYTFYAEQGSVCRRDTMITIDRPDHQFLMPNVITPGKSHNNLIQIFDPLNQMESIMEFQVYDRFGNVLFEKSDFYTDDDSSINWPNGMSTELPDIIVCIAKIKCKEGDEVTMAQDVLILR